MIPSPRPVALSDDPALHDHLEALGLDAGALAAAGVDRSEARWWLDVVDGALGLRASPTHPDPAWHDAQPLVIRPTRGRRGYRLARPLHEAVVRAVRGKGKAARRIHTVVDATAGLGTDGLLLAAAGLSVTLVEGSPWVHALLADALRRLADDPFHDGLVARVTLRHGRAEDVLGAWGPDGPDAVYLDPMFPPASGAQKVGKGMQVLHEVVGPAPDGEAEARLLGEARQAARQRVVVKRPRRAPPLAGVRPSSSLSRKTARFDLYPRPPQAPAP